MLRDRLLLQTEKDLTPPTHADVYKQKSCAKGW